MSIYTHNENYSKKVIHLCNKITRQHLESIQSNFNNTTSPVGKSSKSVLPLEGRQVLHSRTLKNINYSSTKVVGYQSQQADGNGRTDTYAETNYIVRHQKGGCEHARPPAHQFSRSIRTGPTFGALKRRKNLKPLSIRLVL